MFLTSVCTQNSEDAAPRPAHCQRWNWSGWTTAWYVRAWRMLFLKSAREVRFVVTHQSIPDWQLCQFQTVKQLERPKKGQESPKEVNEARKQAMEEEVKCTEMETWEQPRKAETAASRKWTRLNKWNRQSVKAKKYYLNL